MELPACPVETTLMLIGDKWKVLILRDLMDGTKRFGELKKSIGTVSQKVLTAQLRDMEEKGLLTRKVYAEVPPRVEYTLTETGYSLKPVLDAMSAWGTDYRKKEGKGVRKNDRHRFRKLVRGRQSGSLAAGKEIIFSKTAKPRRSARFLSFTELYKSKIKRKAKSPRICGSEDFSVWL